MLTAGPAEKPALQPATRPPDVRAKQRLFLWKVKSAVTTIHILGSIHVAPPSLYPLDPRMEQAYGESKALVVEADVGREASRMPALVYKYGMYPSGRGLRANVPAPLYQALEKQLARVGLSRAAVEPMKPWLVASTLSIMELARLGYPASHGIDNYFLKRARGNKPIEELESAEFQLRMFGSFSPKVQITFLEQTVKELPRLGKTVGRMLKYWKRGDVKAMEQVVFPEDAAQQSPEARTIDEAVYYARNRNMVKKIEAYLAVERPVFIVVGAGHMIGPAGIPALLRKRAKTHGRRYEITRY